MTVEDNHVMFGWFRALVLDFMLDEHDAREQLVQYAVAHPGAMQALNRMAWILASTCPDPECISLEDQEPTLCTCGTEAYGDPGVNHAKTCPAHPSNTTMLNPETPSQYKARWLASIKMLMERHGIEPQDLCEPGDIPTICVHLRRIYADYVESGRGDATEWVHWMEVNDPRLNKTTQEPEPKIGDVSADGWRQVACPRCGVRVGIAPGSPASDVGFCDRCSTEFHYQSPL